MSTPVPGAVSRFSERPGFTMVGETAMSIGPVVVTVDGSAESLHALRTAAELAMTRGLGVVVVNVTGFNPADPLDLFDRLDQRARQSASGILHNSHVTVVDSPGPALIMDFYVSLATSVLVVHSGDLERVSARGIQEMINAPFDLLLLTDTTIPQSASSATKAS